MTWTGRTAPPATWTPPPPFTRTNAGRTMRSAISRRRRGSVSTPFAAITLNVVTGIEVGNTRSTVVVVPLGSVTRSTAARHANCAVSGS